MENPFLVFVARVTMVPGGKQHLPKNRLSDKSTQNPFLAKRRTQFLQSNVFLLQEVLDFEIIFTH